MTLVLWCVRRASCRKALVFGRRFYSAGHASIDTLLIANRGEIACRVMRTARNMGIKTVAVFSEADRGSMHVAMADRAVCIGPAQSTESYLRGDMILSVAKEFGAQAIHPGYGFLSENADFADACIKNKIIFVGPPSQAIRDMGVKNKAKTIMTQAGVPVVQGYHGQEQTDQILLSESVKIGFPVMLKAVLGGGGKGMRIVEKESDFAQQLESARWEAKKSFGDSAMIVEKYVVNPRHVEVQVFGDTHGNYVYLWERDCSVQRRHQKIIEEAPAPGISEEIRQEIGSAAVKAAQAVDYVGAGTVEFIVDATDHSFYFMEMNTRLQVEHPVTEMITGTDLVEWQLRVAMGQTLPCPQQQHIQRNGHAFEARIYAEDAENNFMPGAGPLLHLEQPRASEHLRVETGVRQGDAVSVHYDPMIAKLVVWGQDRQAAARRLDRALNQYHLVGLKTNVQFLRSLLNNADFQKGDVYTGFIDDHYEQLFPKHKPPTMAVICDLVASYLLREVAQTAANIHYDSSDPYSALDSFRVNALPVRQLEFTYSDEKVPVKVNVTRTRDARLIVETMGEECEFEIKLLNATSADVDTLEIEVESSREVRKCKAVMLQNDIHLFNDQGQFVFQVPLPKWKCELLSASSGEGGTVAPMPGIIEKILVEAGQLVHTNDPLVVMVAMKMEYVIKAPGPGTVAEVLCAVGQNVAKHARLVKFQDDTT